MTLKQFRPEGVAAKFERVEKEPERCMFFTSYLTGLQGARYELFKEKQHTKEDIMRAKSYIRNNFDSLSIEIVKETDK